MFDDHQEPKDMFADVPDQDLKQTVHQDTPQQQPSQPGSAQPSMPSARIDAPTAPPQSMQYESPKSHGSFLKLVVMVIISLLCIGGAAYAAYRFMIRDMVTQQVSDVIGEVKDTTTNESGNDTVSDSGTNEEGKGDGVDASAGADEQSASGPVAVVDSDGDGLSNDEEREAGTSVAKPDTDSDGLGDREEVKVYGTDPRNPDTDGDGYSDGEEVKNGYNPNGEGRLLQIPE